MTPRWLVLHLLVLAFVVASIWLGWWQWERSQSASGSFQNLGYALQWPSFGAFAVYMWWRMLRLEARRAKEPEIQPTAESEPEAQHERPPITRPVAPDPEDDADDELAAYNRHLAQLNAMDER